MVALHNNPATAYAMIKTERFFTDEEVKENDSKAVTAYRDVQREYENMDIEEKWRWRDKVMAKHPRLEQIVVTEA
jgi:hypothetical protein